MSFEQLDIDKNFREKREKKEQESKDQFFLEKQILRESADLLNNLAIKIAEQFWIEISEAKNIISGKTSWNLDSLKSIISGERSEAFSDAINSAKKSIEELSKTHRERLKNSLERNNFNIEKPQYISSKLFWEKLVSKARNPQWIGDQLIWIPIGIWESGEAIVIFSYQVWKWILLSPYHLYLILTGKWEYPDFKNI